MIMSKRKTNRTVYPAAFILYCRDNRRKIKENYPTKSEAEVYALLIDLWNKENDEIKLKYKKKEMFYAIENDYTTKISYSERYAQRLLRNSSLAKKNCRRTNYSVSKNDNMRGNNTSFLFSPPSSSCSSGRDDINGSKCVTFIGDILMKGNSKQKKDKNTSVTSDKEFNNSNNSNNDKGFGCTYPLASHCRLSYIPIFSFHSENTLATGSLRVSPPHENEIHQEVNENLKNEILLTLDDEKDGDELATLTQEINELEQKLEKANETIENMSGEIKMLKRKESLKISESSFFETEHTDDFIISNNVREPEHENDIGDLTPGY